jgi:uncharacterized protein (DUF1697 family)
MSRLREVLVEAGFSDVRTYVQSGNVITRSLTAARTGSPLPSAR